VLEEGRHPVEVTGVEQPGVGEDEAGDLRPVGLGGTVGRHGARQN